MVDWDIFGEVFHSYSQFQQIGITKYVHGLWYTGSQKVKFKQDQQGLCPSCKEAEESMSHVFQCKDPAVTSHRQDQLQTFYEYLDEQELLTPVRQCIFAGVLGWLGSTEPSQH